MPEHTLFPSLLPDDEDTRSIDEGPELNPPPGDLTVGELRDRIRDTDHVPLLEAMRGAEADGKNRTSALEALDSRLGSLKEE